MRRDNPKLKAEVSTHCLRPGTAEKLATHRALRGGNSSCLEPSADTRSQTFSLLPGKQHVCHLSQATESGLFTEAAAEGVVLGGEQTAWGSQGAEG